MTKFGYCSRFGAFLALKKNDSYTLYRGRCKQWSCPECSQLLRSKWRSFLALKIAELGGNWSFITITAPSYGNAPYMAQLDKSARLFKTEMNTVMQFIRDNWGKHAYVRVLEIQRRGAIHAHILINLHFPWPELRVIRRGPNTGRCYVPRLKEACKKRGFGTQIDVEVLSGQALQVSTYLTKYITKDSRLGESWLPKNTRYIQTSHDIGALPDYKGENVDEWTVVKPDQVWLLLERGAMVFDGDKKDRQVLPEHMPNRVYEL